MFISAQRCQIKFKLVSFDFTYFTKHHGGGERCKKSGLRPFLEIYSAYLLDFQSMFNTFNTHVSHPLIQTLPLETIEL